MKIQIDVNDIHQVLKVSTAEKVSIVAYENIVYIMADVKSGKDDLSLDYVMYKVDYTWVVEPGETLINREVLQSLPISGELTITEDTLECGNRKISYKPNECGVKPTTNLVEICTIDRKIFNDLIEVEYAIAQDDTRPILTGICMNENDFVSADGFRVAIRSSHDLNIPQTLLPAKLIKTYKKIKSKADKVTILETENNIALKVGNVVIVVSKLSGEYIKYKSIIPKEFSRQAEVSSKEFLSLLKSYKNVKYVILNFTKDELTITAKNENLTIEDKLECEFKGEDFEIAFNIKYLIDLVKHYENLVMKFYSSVSPLVITDGNKLDMLLPIRIVKEAE